MTGASLFSASRDQFEVRPFNAEGEVPIEGAFRISLQLISVFGVALLLSSHGNAQISQIGNIGPAASWAAQVINRSCSSSPSLLSFIKSITVSSGVATMVTYRPLSGEPPCGDDAAGNSITISNTFTCFDATWTVLTGTSNSPWTYTFSTNCPASFAIRDDYMIGPQPMVDNSGNIWVFFNYEEVPVLDGDEGKVVAVRKSTDGGASWKNPTVVLEDTSGSCSDRNNCAMNGTGVGVAPNGNIVLLSGEYDYSSGKYVALLTTHYDGLRWSAPSAIRAVPPGEMTWSWCYAEETIFTLPGGALGAEVVGTGGPYPAMCENNNVYLLISCDNGQTWGSGIGCRGPMQEYVESTMRPIGTSADFPTTESTLNWIGGRTLLGFIRNLTWTSGCSSPCGPLVEMYSKDLGFSWTFADTKIEGQAVDAPTKAYTEVSPWLYYTGFGRLWTLFYGDRESTGTYSQMVRQITFDPERAIRDPSDLTPGEILFGQPGPDALGSYTHAIPTSRWNLLIWFDMYPVDLTGARQVLQMPASYLSPEGADPFLRVQPSSTTVHQGDLLTYAFPVWNLGPGNAVHEVLNTRVPVGTTFDYIRISGTPGLGTCTHPPYHGTGQIICHENGIMAPNTTWTVRLTVKVTAPAGTVITENATTLAETPDPNPANNIATVSIKVQSNGGISSSQ